MQCCTEYDHGCQAFTLHCNNTPWTSLRASGALTQSRAHKLLPDQFFWGFLDVATEPASSNSLPDYLLHVLVHLFRTGEWNWNTRLRFTVRGKFFHLTDLVMWREWIFRGQQWLTKSKVQELLSFWKMYPSFKFNEQHPCNALAADSQRLCFVQTHLIHLCQRNRASIQSELCPHVTSLLCSDVAPIVLAYLVTCRVWQRTVIHR